MKKATIIGAGLAGSEAAWQLARAEIPVTLYEMRPKVSTKAHKTGMMAELVCSNSFRGAELSQAVGLLKEELRHMGSLVFEAAEQAKVPAGGALAVDRDIFSEFVDERLRSHPLVTVVNEEIAEIPESSENNTVIIASGPLTSASLSNSIEKLTGESHLAFFDAISPIVTADSIDYNKVFRQSRYDKGDSSDYLNIPLSKEQYYQFVSDVEAAPKYTGNEDVENDSLDKLRPFEGCMPIEDMIERGPDTLLFGPFKPVGLTDPSTGKRPYAVCQLRQDNKEGTLWSLVGLQTRMKTAEQRRILKTLPGLENAEFVRLGSVHRNTFINSPACLKATLQFHNKAHLFFAGQITGVEGYVESTAGGLVAGINASRLLKNKEPLIFPPQTAIGALMNYISNSERKDFQPMNISFGLIPSYIATTKREPGTKKRKLGKRERRLQAAERALEAIEAVKAQILD